MFVLSKGGGLCAELKFTTGVPPSIVLVYIYVMHRISLLHEKRRLKLDYMGGSPGDVSEIPVT